MPYPYINIEKAYILMHQVSVEPSPITPDLINQLSGLAAQFLGLTQAKAQDFTTALNTHLGPHSTYRQRQLIIDTLNAIYHRVICLELPLSDDTKKAIFIKLSENITECSPGFHNRVVQIHRSFYALPLNLDGLLAQIRLDIVESTATQAIEKEIQANAGHYEQGLEVHTHNAFYTQAHLLGYGVPPFNAADVHRGYLSASQIKKNLEISFDQHYNVPGIIFRLIELIRDKVSIEQDYKGLNPQGYLSGEYGQWLELLKHIFSEEESHYHYLLSEDEILDEDDQVIKPYTITDINWTEIKKALFIKLLKNHYFNLSGPEQACLACVFNLEKLNIGDLLSSEDRNKSLISNTHALRYLLSFMVEHYEPDVCFHLIEWFVLQRTDDPSHLLPILTDIISVIEKSEHLLLITILHYQEMLFPLVAPLFKMDLKKIVSTLNQQNQSELILLKHILNNLTQPLPIQFIDVGFVLAIYLDNLTLMKQNLPEAEYVIPILCQFMRILEKNPLLLDFVKQHYKEAILRYIHPLLSLNVSLIHTHLNPKNQNQIALIKHGLTLLGAPVQFKDIQTGLWVAALIKDLDLMIHLLEGLGDLAFKHGGNQTPLHITLSNGADELSALLLFKALNLTLTQQTDLLRSLPNFVDKDTVLSYTARCNPSLLNKLIIKLKLIENKSLLKNIIQVLFSLENQIAQKDLETNERLLDLIKHGISLFDTAFCKDKASEFMLAIYRENADLVNHLLNEGLSMSGMKLSTYKKALDLAISKNIPDLMVNVLFEALKLCPAEQSNLLENMHNFIHNDEILIYSMRCESDIFQKLIIKILAAPIETLSNNINQLSRIDTVQLIDALGREQLLYLLECAAKITIRISPNLFKLAVNLNALSLIQSINVEVMTARNFPNENNALDIAILNQSHELVVLLLIKALKLDEKLQTEFINHQCQTTAHCGALMATSHARPDLFNPLVDKLKEKIHETLLQDCIIELLSKSDFNRLIAITKNKPLSQLIEHAFSQWRFNEVTNLSAYRIFQFAVLNKADKLIPRLLDHAMLGAFGASILAARENILKFAMQYGSNDLVNSIISKALFLNDTEQKYLLSHIRRSDSTNQEDLLSYSSVLIYTAQCIPELFNQLMMKLINLQDTFLLNEEYVVAHNQAVRKAWELAIMYGSGETVNALWTASTPSLSHNIQDSLTLKLAIQYGNIEAITALLQIDPNRLETVDILALMSHKKIKNHTVFIRWILELAVTQLSSKKLTPVLEKIFTENTDRNQSLPSLTLDLQLRLLTTICIQNCNEAYEPAMTYALKYQINDSINKLLDKKNITITPRIFHDIMANQSTPEAIKIKLLVKACRLLPGTQAEIIGCQHQTILAYLMKEKPHQYLNKVLIELNKTDPNINKKIAFLNQINFDSHLQKISNKIIELNEYNTTKKTVCSQRKATEASKLYEHLINAKAQLLQSDSTLNFKKIRFKTDCTNRINDAMPFLEQHRGFKKILTVLLLILAFPIALPLYAAGFFSTKTDSAIKLNAFTQALNATNQY